MTPLTEEQIKHMVSRFLGWRLPENFSPDCGISFDADAAKKLNPRNQRYEPTGTNLFDATQAIAMVRHMLEGLPTADAPLALVCPTCNGFRRIRFAEGTCEPAHNEDCPTCVGRPVPGVPGLRIMATIPGITAEDTNEGGS